MKFLVLLAAIGCASAASSNAVTCDECRAGTVALVDHLLTDASLAEQTEILKAVVCPQLEDADACTATIDMWFNDIATCIYNHFIVETDVCTEFGICKKASIFTPRDWTCEECTNLLTMASAVMEDEATVAEGVEYLQGECFCGADGHSADCADMVAGIVPLAMPVLAGVLVDQEVELCQEILGVC
eukprot:TRINITY_DN4855_c0_g1_i2.p1 TRINITY_DN4855_c0_g1~~TRINITY_DN4855_c0_g1_i2.p1  ORF type:complete len:208 (-),score=80.66 TRINITY_DN4855_c0_g1_i2:74-631(-)